MGEGTQVMSGRLPERVRFAHLAPLCQTQKVALSSQAPQEQGPRTHSWTLLASLPAPAGLPPGASAYKEPAWPSRLLCVPHGGSLPDAGQASGWDTGRVRGPGRGAGGLEGDIGLQDLGFVCALLGRLCLEVSVWGFFPEGAVCFVLLDRGAWVLGRREE